MIEIFLMLGIVCAIDYTVVDKNGNINDLVNTGCDYRWIDEAFVCWGNDYITMNYSAIGTYTGSAFNFTIAIWSKYNSTSLIPSSSNYGYIMADDTVTSNFYVRYYVTGGTVYHTFTLGGSGAGNVGSNAINSANNWHLYVITYNQTHACGYWDGSLDACFTATYTGGDPASRTLRLANNGALTRDMDGELKGVRTWNSVLTASEISDLYNYNYDNVSTSTQIARYDFKNINPDQSTSCLQYIGLAYFRPDGCEESP